MTPALKAARTAFSFPVVNEPAPSSATSWRRCGLASATGFSFAGLGGRRPRRSASVVTAASSASISASSNRLNAPARSLGKKWRGCKARLSGTALPFGAAEGPAAGAVGGAENRSGVVSAGRRIDMPANYAAGGSPRQQLAGLCTRKLGRLRAVALVTERATRPAPRSQTTHGTKEPNLAADRVAQIRLAARRYLIEDICKKLLHLLLIDRRESKPALQQGLRAVSFKIPFSCAPWRRSEWAQRSVIQEIVAPHRGAFNVDADLHVLTPSPDPGPQRNLAPSLANPQPTERAQIPKPLAGFSLNVFDDETHSSAPAHQPGRLTGNLFGWLFRPLVQRRSPSKRSRNRNRLMKSR